MNAEESSKVAAERAAVLAKIARFEDREGEAQETAHSFLVSSMDQAGEELDRFDAAAQRKIPDLAGDVTLATSVVFLAHRLEIVGERIENGLKEIARSLAKATPDNDCNENASRDDDR